MSPSNSIESLINPHLVSDTKKVYYSKFCFRVELNVGRAHLLHYCKGRSEIEFMQQLHHNSRPISPVLNFELSTIYLLGQALQLFGKNVIRSKNNYNSFSVFFQTEADLVKFLEHDIPTLIPLVIAVNRPRSIEHMALLLTDTIFVYSPSHQFKVMVRKGLYSTNEVDQIETFLENNKDDLDVSSGLRYNLSTRYNSSAIRNHIYLDGYLLTDNFNQILFLKMLSDRFVHKIHKLEPMNMKTTVGPVAAV